MGRVYKRRVGARPYKNYAETTLEAAVEEVANGKPLREVSDRHGIPIATLSRKFRGLHGKVVGRPTAMNVTEEKLGHLALMAAEWGFPLTALDVRRFVKLYYERKGMMHHWFKDNLSGPDWARNFLARNERITERLCQNIKRTRAAVTPETINSYFDELEVTLRDVEANAIVNNDETNITDDPGKSKVIVRRGVKRTERILDHSKTSISVMFSGSASGILLPPMVCYRAEHLYNTWTEGGPEGTRYNRSKSGWFNEVIFLEWFETVAPRYFKTLPAGEPKVLIGDNLASHISPSVIEKCSEMNIRFQSSCF